jgi:glycosyltransferase involved in cell wall biosynthesis
MRILLLTFLYPGPDSTAVRRQRTIAIHDFVRWWVREPDVSVTVVRLVQLVGRHRRPVTRRSSQYKRDGITVTALEFLSYARAGWLGWRSVLRKIRRSGYEKWDLIVGHCWPATEIAQRLAQHIGTPYVLGIHGSDLSKLFRSRHAIQNAAGLVFRSHAISRHFPRQYRRIPSIVALSGLPDDCFSLSHRRFTRKWREVRSGGRIRIVFAGSLIPLKNVDVVLRALHRVFRSGEFVFDIFGDGPLWRELQELAGELGIGQDVVFHGRCSRGQVLESMKDAHFFVMPSAPETLGLAFLEAMSQGAVVVGAKRWGIDGFVEDGVNGLLVQPRKLTDLVTIFGHARDAERLARIGRRAMESVAELSEDGAAKTYLRFLGQVVTESRRGKR